MKKVHIITASTAFAMGLTAGLIAAGAPEVSAKSKDNCETIRSELSLDQRIVVEDFMVANLADDAEAAFGPGKLTLAHAKQNGITISWRDIGTLEEKAYIANHSCVAGQWTAGEAP